MKPHTSIIYLLFTTLLLSCAETNQLIVSNSQVDVSRQEKTNLKTDDETFIIHEGHYYGENIYVQNPFAGNGEGCCVTKVEVNGEVSDCSITAGAFEIDLAKLDLKHEDPFTIKITHKTDCQPKFLNPINNGPRHTVQFSGVKIKQNILFWTAEEVKTDSCFYIEQYRWNRWIVVGQVDTTTSNVSVVNHLHSGENKFRIKQFHKSDRPTTSNSVTVMTDTEKITFDKKYNNFNRIDFTRETPYQLYNTDGEIVIEGDSNQIDLFELPNGTYYLNFDSTTGKIIKLKR
jgi:hypothetical protein